MCVSDCVCVCVLEINIYEAHIIFTITKCILKKAIEEEEHEEIEKERLNGAIAGNRNRKANKVSKYQL